MNSAIHTASASWETPFNRTYLRTGAYWLSAVTLVCLANASILTWPTVCLILLATPLAILLLVEFSRLMRRYANVLILSQAPDLEFSGKSSLGFHAIRTLLIVLELAAAFLVAKLLCSLLAG